MPHLCMCKGDGSCGKPSHYMFISQWKSEPRVWWGKIVVGWLVDDGGQIERGTVWRNRKLRWKNIMKEESWPNGHKRRKQLLRMDDNPAVHQVRLLWFISTFHCWYFASFINGTVVVTGNDRRRWDGIRKRHKPIRTRVSHMHHQSLLVVCCRVAYILKFCFMSKFSSIWHTGGVV